MSDFETSGQRMANRAMGAALWLVFTLIAASVVMFALMMIQKWTDTVPKCECVCGTAEGER